MPSVQVKRGTRAQLDNAATSSGLKAGEVYLITDENRLAVGLTVSTYQAFDKQNEAIGVHAREPGLASGRYVSPMLNGNTLSTKALIADELDFIPFIPVRTIAVSELSAEVTSAVPSSNIKLGIYAADSNGNPSAKLEGSGNLSSATTGAKTYAISRTLYAHIVYWLAIHSSDPVTMRAMAVTDVMGLGGDATVANSYNVRQSSYAFASGLPATAPSSTLASTRPSLLRLKIA